MESSNQQTQTEQGYLTEEQALRLLASREMRREAAKTFRGFCAIYLPHYLKLPPADFHAELQGLLEDWTIHFLNIVGFRGSAKSTFISLALPIWAALEGKSKFILPFSDTAVQAKLNLSNIRHELEDNDLLKIDYGDQSAGISKQQEWTQNNLLLACGARILSRSRGQRVRGLRHREYRPDLVIVDDPEELEKVQKKEYRDKTERWLRSDVIPAIEEFSARLIVTGNILHTDALMARLKNDPTFEHREYPLITNGGIVAWRGKYQTQESLDQQERKVGRTAWLREYLLKVVPPEGQEIKEEWIQYYDSLPKEKDERTGEEHIAHVLSSGVGIDLAISKKETADFTSMVSGANAVVNGMPKIFILPNPTNERFSFHETLQAMKNTYNAMRNLALPLFFIEDVAYQKAAIEEAQRNGIPTIAMKAGTDKRARLRAAATFVQNGTVLFPRRGAEDLITQLLGFGVEDHDDLVDAFVYLILGLTQQGLEKPEVIGLL